MEIDRSLRTARAAVFAAACVGVSAAGHVWMSGSAIPPWALLAALLATGGAGYALAGRQRGFISIAGLMLIGELGLHSLFAAAQYAAAATPSATSEMGDMPGMPQMSGMSAHRAIPASAWLCGNGKDMVGGVHGVMSMPWMSQHGGTAGMIAVHALAGLLCAWWLRRGEAATFHLLRALALFAAPFLVIIWPLAPAVAGVVTRIQEDRDAHTPTGSRLLVHAVIRRGPPAPAFCM